MHKESLQRKVEDYEILIDQMQKQLEEANGMNQRCREVIDELGMQM